MYTILSYFKQEVVATYQGLNKDFYNRLIPRAMIKFEFPRVAILLERARKQFYIGFWRENVRQLHSQLILSIGDDEAQGQISAARLGFSEIYFQYFIDLGDGSFAVFPIEQEAILKKGFIVRFDSKWRF